ncbi:MAG: two-component system sensor histidine kinase RpfC [Candidatus Krumholzibacteriia bacterium]|jgi:two-component system sensor histidine kinase RpfC
MFASPESLHNKVDEERSQSRARVAISIVSFVAYVGMGLVNGSWQTKSFAGGLSTIVAYFVFALVWFSMVKRRPGKNPGRRLVTIATDLGIMTFFMFLGSQHVTSYYPIFLWVIIGNGIRFGERFLQFGVIAGTIGFGSLLIFDEYWNSHLNLGIGLLLGVIVLPMFFMGVLRRLRRVTALEVELAKSKLADKAKDQFLATMSHEIRTPMNGVLGMAESLRETKLDEEQKEHLEIITSSVESLLHIINDILDYSKITANNLTLESVPFDLRQVLGDVKQLLNAAAEAKHIDLQFEFSDDKPRHFRGDPTRLRQIALNLVGNAIKFTASGRVKLFCKINAKDPAKLKLIIEDTGIGIPEDRLLAIFKQFEQGDNSTTREFGGTGLGLAISRRLALMMGGEVSVESAVGEGSVFTVDLVLEPCAPPALPKSLPTVKNLPNYGYKALVVEDNKFNQIVMQNLVKRIGITVDIAENGAEALEMVDQNEYDLIFMDVRMPVMNGHEATQHIRARSDAKAQLPIIAVTAEATKHDVGECLNSGMDRHLSKPLRIVDLVAIIDDLGILKSTLA